MFSELKRLQGLPYIWGGASNFGLDCSGLVIYLLRMLGHTQFVYQKSLVFDVTADNLYKYNTKPIADLKSLKKGDLIFFDMNEDNVYDHVVIFEKFDQSTRRPLLSWTSLSRMPWLTLVTKLKWLCLLSMPHRVN